MPVRPTRQQCAAPPHTDHRWTVTRYPAAAEAPRRVRRALRWMAAAPADRASLPAAAAIYGTGAALAAAHVPPLGILPVTAGTAGVVYGAVLHTGKDPRRAARAAAAAGLAGGWLAAAAEWGVLAGPDGLLSLVYLGATGIGYGMLRADEHVRARRQWRAARTEWHLLAHRFGLTGSHLLSREDTRLGETLLVDVTGTGKRASQLAGADVAERIAEHYRLPAVRVQVAADKIAGRLRVNIRHRDPWAEPILHPLLDTEPEIQLPPVATVREPLVIGQDPESGRPLTLTVWDEDGARHTLIVAINGGGKTVVLNDITERITAAGDALVWDINISKAKETRRWAPACDLTAIGPGERKKALQILRLAHKAIDYRAAMGSDDAVFQPSPASPLIVVKIDELDTLAGVNDPMGQAFRDELGYLVSKGRSEGVAVVAAGQRGTVSHVGDGDIRTQFRNVALLKVSRRNEAMHAAGDIGLELPDMSRYGEGHAGVVLIAADFGGSVNIGRSFKLSDLRDIDRLAATRTPPALEPGLAEHLGDALAALKDPVRTAGITRLSHPASHTAPAQDPARPGWLAELDADLEDALPADLRAIADRNEATRRMLAETAAIPLPEIPPEHAALAAEAARIRRDQAAAEVTIPEPVQERLRALLAAPDGTTVRKAAAALSVSVGTAWAWLDRLRLDGAAEIRGKGRAARWHAPGGDGQ